MRRCISLGPGGFNGSHPFNHTDTPRLLLPAPHDAQDEGGGRGGGEVGAEWWIQTVGFSLKWVFALAWIKLDAAHHDCSM